MADGFDTFWRWVLKDLADHAITMDAELHYAATITGSGLARSMEGQPGR
jgi:hypothetical protein